MGGWRMCRAMAAFPCSRDLPAFYTRLAPVAVPRTRYHHTLSTGPVKSQARGLQFRRWVCSVAAPEQRDLVLRDILDAEEYADDSGSSDDDDGVYDVESEDEEEELCMDGVDVSAATQLANQISNLKGSQLDLVVPEVKRWIRVGNEVNKNNFLFVIAKLRSRKLYVHAIKIANWMEDRKPVAYDARDEIRRVELYSHCGWNYRAEKIFQRIPEGDRTERAYNAMLLGYSKRKMRRKSEFIFEKLKANELFTSSYAFNLMAGLYRYKGADDKILELEDEARQCGIELDISFKNILIPAKHKVEGIQAALNMFQVIKSSDSPESLVTTYVAMAECYAAEKQFEEAKDLLQEIEQSLSRTPFRPAYSMLITTYTKMRYNAGVRRVWEKLVDRVGTPLTREFITVIKSWGSMGEVEISERMFNQAESSGKVSPKIFSAMFSVYAKMGMLSRAQELEKRMKEELGIKLDPEAYYHLEDLYVNKGMINEAIEVLKESEQAGAKRGSKKPLESSLALVLGAVAEIPDIELAKKLMGEWKEAGYELTSAHYNQLLVGYIKVGEPVDGFVERMLMDDVRPDAKTQALFEELERKDKGAKKQKVTN